MAIRNPAREKRIAKQRIDDLFSQADQAFGESKERANRYVALARKIGMKYNVRVPKAHQRKFCKHCYSYLMPGENCRVRTREGKVVYTCMECKKFTRYPMNKEQKAKRSGKD